METMSSLSTDYIFIYLWDLRGNLCETTMSVTVNSDLLKGHQQHPLSVLPVADWLMSMFIKLLEQQTCVLCLNV